MWHKCSAEGKRGLWDCMGGGHPGEVWVSQEEPHFETQKIRQAAHLRITGRKRYNSSLK